MQPTISFRASLFVLAIALPLSLAHADEAKIIPGRFIVTLRASAASSAETGRAPLPLSAHQHTLSDGRTVILEEGAQSLDSSRDDDHEALTCESLLATGRVLTCSPDYEVHSLTVPNDPRVGELWGMSQPAGISALSAWNFGVDASGVVVAVIDTGVDYTHPDLADNIWTNPGEIAGDGIDNDGNGYIDDVHGINAAQRTGDPMDDNGHGTHVAGTIAARGNNGIGVIGVAPTAKILPIKFLNSSGSGALSDVFIGLDYLIALKRRGVNIRVANNSWGGGLYVAHLESLIRTLQDEGIVFVAAAANDSNNNDLSPRYPASYDVDNVVAVAASTPERTRASFSNYGATSVDLAAPGTLILSTSPGGGYRTLSGTSMATPHVSGALALLFALAPELSPRAALARLYGTAVAAPAFSGLTATGAILDAYQLLASTGAPVPPVAPPSSCDYVLENAVLPRDPRADRSAPLVRGDELGYTTVELPFPFPFYEGEVRSLTLSPNGVVYLQGAPSTSDFLSDGLPPGGSIAVAYADLVALRSGQGVRVRSSEDRVTIAYKMSLFGDYSGRDIAASLTLFPDGSIEQRLEAPSAKSRELLRSRAIIGLASLDRSRITTFSTPGAPAIDGTVSLRYTRRCASGDQEGSINALEIRRVTRQGDDRQSRLVPGGRLKIAATGGDGTVRIDTALDGYPCGSVEMDLHDGSGTLEGRLPRTDARKLLIHKNGLRSSHAIRRSSSSAGPRNRKARRAALARSCGQLLRSLR